MKSQFIIATLALYCISRSIDIRSVRTYGQVFIEFFSTNHKTFSICGSEVLQKKKKKEFKDVNGEHGGN